MFDDAEFANRARRLKLLILDVDGVMTDGRIIWDSAGNEQKAFNVRDGHGIKMLQRCGIDVAIITGRSSRVVDIRAEELGIKEVLQGAHDKLSAYEGLVGRMGLSDDETAYVGDDIVDIPVMKRVGLSFAVSDSEHYVKAAAHAVTERKGGEGAVREVIDRLLVSRGDWDKAVSKYFS